VTEIDIGADQLRLLLPSGASASIPWGPVNLTERWLGESDPPHPAALTNALGMVDDHLDDVEREHPEIVLDPAFVVSGDHATALAWLELGRVAPGTDVALTRQAAEEVFRLVATERSVDRAHNPGLPFEHVDTIVATCCVVLAVMRRFDLPELILATPGRA
jgi:exopolyphosphatase/pppGpp-phosphohydrolase